jgi:hypothetical protein
VPESSRHRTIASWARQTALSNPILFSEGIEFLDTSGFSPVGYILTRNQVIACELPQTAAIWHITCSLPKSVDHRAAEASSDSGSAHRS